LIFSSWLENSQQFSNDIKNVIVEMRKSGHKLQEIADTLNIPRGTVSDVVVRFKRRGSVENKNLL
jgi:DNA-binding IclR family transcriptional regulator